MNRTRSDSTRFISAERIDVRSGCTDTGAVEMPARVSAYVDRADAPNADNKDNDGCIWNTLMCVVCRLACVVYFPSRPSPGDAR